MELVGKMVRLRSLEKRDLVKMAAWNQDQDLQLFVDCDLPVDLTQLERWFDENVPGRTYQIFAIETLEGELIGDLELDHICWKKHEAEVRIRIGEKEYWGQGYGTEAMQLILHQWLVEKNFNRIYLRVYHFNGRAIRCYQKNGFKQVGILQRRDPEWKDIVLMETSAGLFKRKLRIA